jgi:hypothetical protein
MGTPIVLIFISRDLEFKPDIGHGPFQHVSDQGPNDCKEETVDDGDGFGRFKCIEKEMKSGHEDD